MDWNVNLLKILFTNVLFFIFNFTFLICCSENIRNPFRFQIDPIGNSISNKVDFVFAGFVKNKNKIGAILKSGKSEEIVFKKDSINDFRIEEITTKYVLLSGKNKKFKLFID